MTSNVITFRQHIKTSSRARKGYRTYQYTPPMDEQTDEKLGGYGVYVSTAYSDMSSIGLGERPELFLFYNLDPKTKVVSRSTYVGFDLHSYPPRPGNYVSHALVTDSQHRFNPVELYKKAAWKTGDIIAAEDSSNDPIPINISPLSMQVDPEFIYLDCFDELLLPTFSDPGISGGKTASRQKMFMAVVDAIIRRQKVLIIDDKSTLLNWAMCLLQSFPLDFVHRHLSITSFANSHTLMDICQVLCFETENSERVKRMADRATVIDINNAGVENPGIYARSLLTAIQKGDFAHFRDEVFSKISAAAYTPELFNKCADLFHQMPEVPYMPAQKFETFFTSQADDAQNVERIISIVQRYERADLCNIIWRTLLKKKPPTADDLSTYRVISQYIISHLTDDLWIKLESEVADKLLFSRLDQVSTFFSVTNILSPDRNTPFINKVIPLINSNQQQTIKERGICMIKDFVVGEITADQKSQLEKIQDQIDFMDQLEKAPASEQYPLFLRAYEYEKLGKAFVLGCVSHLKQFTWHLFFNWPQWDINSLRSLFEIAELSFKLPDKALALCVLQSECSPKTFRFHFEQLTDNEQKDFVNVIPLPVRDRLMDSLSLEKVLTFVPHVNVHDALNRYIARCFRDSQQSDLWSLCNLIHNPTADKSKFPNTIIHINGSNLKPVYDALDNDVAHIPIEHIRIARLLSEKGKIKRPVPAAHMDITLDHIRAIGRLDHMGQVAKYVKNKRFDEQVLRSLIKLPWPHYAWEVLFNELDNRNKEKLPVMLKNILTDLQQRYPASSKSAAAINTPLLQWQHIIYQYAVFLIVKDEYSHYLTLLNTIRPSWEDYKIIRDQLVCLMPEENNTYTAFKSPSNKKGFLFTRTHGPTWR
ncbi:hypothetical protein [Chitinophaga sp. S165]|uniref:GAP1-N2 domain-containing protein n=1 Tax=Chitinophaga sp. S165 TaxID=2135462 RepID=UPI000D71C260|nr:hypothetical protein [Chitinophaga sp. S165]PWV45827.1 hypothetical protein C7475_11244 [Chitinophaga sp. S165]